MFFHLFGPPRSLTAAETRTVLKAMRRSAKLQADNDVKSRLDVRGLVTDALVECTFWRAVGRGEEREIRVTNKIAESLKVCNLAGVEVWAGNKKPADLVNALDDMLARPE